MTVFSKPISNEIQKPQRKEHEVPIPLFSENFFSNADNSTVKVKVYKEPANSSNMEKIEKTYHLFDPSCVEEFCAFREELDMFIAESRLSSYNSKFHGAHNLLT